MKKEYSWTISGVFKADANAVGKELEKLGDNVTPDSVLEVAKDENNVMHDMFEWDDSIAGQKYRLSQARHIIANIRVNIISDDSEKRPVRAFVSIKRNAVFEPIEKVVKDTDRYSILLNSAYRELTQIKYRYDTLSEIQDLLKDIPEVN